MRNIRPTLSCRANPRSDSGFTLIEVLAALLIAAVAITYLIQSETASVQKAAKTAELRQATLLGRQKLQEILSGLEGEATGEFETPPGWSWEAIRQPGPGNLSTVMITLKISFAKNRTLTLEQIVP